MSVEIKHNILRQCFEGKNIRKCTFGHVLSKDSDQPPYQPMFLAKTKVSMFLFVLRFYGPVNPMGLCRAYSVYLTALLLDRLSRLSGSPVCMKCQVLLSGRNKKSISKCCLLNLLPNMLESNTQAIALKLPTMNISR